MFAQTALNSLDSYKLGHPDQYPAGTRQVVSNFTPRSITHLNVPREFKQKNKIIWFGALQLFLQELNHVWETTFFSRAWGEIDAEAQKLYPAFCGPNGYVTKRLRKLWERGYLPIEIKALPEGSFVDVNVPVLTITNTSPDEYWLPNSLETWLSFDLWRSSTSATIAFVYRDILEAHAYNTGASKDFIMWQGHDFSPRGMGGFYDAARSGLGHLTSFWGTDNIPAADAMNKLYGGGMYGSVPATEHAVMCAGGKANELETFRRIIKTYPNGIVSIVSDTWNFWNVVGGPTSIAAQLKDEILARGYDAFGNSKVVFRPDSGDPVRIITGYDVVGYFDTEAEFYAKFDNRANFDKYSAVSIADKFYRAVNHDFCRVAVGEELSVYEVDGAVQCLAGIFGWTINDAGYRNLCPRVGLIYGDSITADIADEMLQRLADKGWASDNIVLGIGSFTYQYNTRDTLGFAMKATAVVNADNELIAISKDPITDNGTKKSASGLLRVDIDIMGDYVLTQNCTWEEFNGGELKVVYRNGEVLLNDSMDEIRARINEHFAG